MSGVQIAGKRLNPIPRYDWADPEMGPGCGVSDHAADCLCDVHVGTPVPIVHGYDTIMFGRYAQWMMEVEHVSARDFHEWATLMLGGFEAERAFTAGAPSPADLLTKTRGRRRAEGAPITRGTADPFNNARSNRDHGAARAANMNRKKQEVMV